MSDSSSDGPWTSSSSSSAQPQTRGGFHGRGRGRGALSRPNAFGLIPSSHLRYKPHKSRSGVTDKPPTSAAYGRTLGFVTTAKLDELEKQREAYKEFSRVLDATITDPQIGTDENRALINRLSVLHHSVINHLAPDDPRDINGSINIDDLGIWLARVRIDPTFDRAILKEWIETLETHIKQGEKKLEFAKLCGRLYTDWLESGDGVTVRSDVSGPLPQQDRGLEEDVRQEGRQEMHKQVARLRSIIFELTNIDTAALEGYLTGVFSTKAASALLEDMRAGMAAFGKDLRNRTITADDMRWTVESLLASDLMLPDKRAALREFTDNNTVLEEVANVVNMRLRGLSSWKWPADGIMVDMRRQLHGKYRAFTDPDVLDGLFLEWVGVMWGIKFKQDVRVIFQSNAWNFATPGEGLSSVTSDTVASSEANNVTINGERKNHRNSYFLTGILPDKVGPQANYDGAAYDAGSDYTEGAMDVKQRLLNIISTECHLNLGLHSSHTMVVTDLDWFGPSLPHESIITILRFFGVPQEWLEFFRTFLHMPVRFPKEPQARTRVRGTPISYALSAFFGEAVLFSMDFAVNQRAHGLFVYRIHDDTWFWDSNPRRCELAWKEMNKYASLVGLTFNKSKTGFVCVRTPPEILEGLELPEGDIRWGFLKFDPREARFVIDQEQVDEHIGELKRQLKTTKSVLGWIGVYNKYMAFFLRNFGGRPAESFGRQHVKDVSRTLVRIQQEVIAGENENAGGVIECLEKELATRYGVRDLPRGYFYFPLSSGGLALLDPLIDIMVMGESMTGDAAAVIKEALLKEQDVYEQAKKTWETEKRQEIAAALAQRPPVPPPVFPSFPTYCEVSSSNIDQVYTSLVTVKKPRQAKIPPVINSAMTSCAKSKLIGESYKGWIVEAYGLDIARRFGGLDIVDPRMIPIGLVHLYTTSRIKWFQ